MMWQFLAFMLYMNTIPETNAVRWLYDHNTQYSHIYVNICAHLYLPRHEPADFCPSTFANKKASNRISHCT